LQYSLNRKIKKAQIIVCAFLIFVQNTKSFAVQGF